MILAIYSHKDEVGCTMAAVNMGVLLCRDLGKRVLLVDWNFAGAKLLPWVQNLRESPTGDLMNSGLLELLTAFEALLEGDIPISADRLPRWQDYTYSTTIPGLVYMPLTKRSLVSGHVALFDWASFYRNNLGGAVVEYLKEEWRKSFDMVIAISGKRASNSASVCTLQLADTIMLMMSPNLQEIESSRQVAQMISLHRQRKGKPVRILPILSSVLNAEKGLLQEIRKKVEDFSVFLPAEIDASTFNRCAEIPFLPYYSYSSEIAALVEKDEDEIGLSSAYRRICHQLVALEAIRKT
jgi:hypothetical protein